MRSDDYELRKRDHIRYALEPDSQATEWCGFERIHLNHDALPDLNFEDVVLDSCLLGKPTKTPFFVAAITAGHPDADPINRALCLACAKRGWTFGLGSQRKELESLSRGDADHQTTIEKLGIENAELVVLANVGISQIISSPLSCLKKLVKLNRAKALVVHTNPLQEALQSEGTPRFRGALESLKRVCGELGYPVILKETGCGFSADTLKRLNGIGLAAVDISGLGGTHWGRIEGARAMERARESVSADIRAKASRVFSTWGEPTVDSVMHFKDALSGVELWASGGVRSGLDAAKLLAMGAAQVGYAKPALEAALQGEQAVERWMEQQEFELKVALFCTGSKSPIDLGKKNNTWKEAKSL